MATKNYFISCKNHRIASGFTDSDFNPTQQRAELEGAGATIVNDFDNIDGQVQHFNETLMNFDEI